MRRRDWLRLCCETFDLVVETAKGEGLLGPAPAEDLGLLREQLQSLPKRGERKAVPHVLLFQPPGTETEIDPSSRHMTGCHDQLREHGRMPECDG